MCKWDPNYRIYKQINIHLKTANYSQVVSLASVILDKHTDCNALF